MSHESIDLPPTLEELTAFPTRSHGKVNIPEQIGRKYTEFGIQLLKERTGARVSNMEEKHRGDPQKINTEILQEWLQNEHGKRPVSWRTLVEVLRHIKLGELARDIEVACLQDKITVNSSRWRTSHQSLWQNRRKLVTAAVLVYFIVIVVLIRNTVTQPTPEVAMSTTTQSPILLYAKVLSDKYQMQRVIDPSQWLQVVMPFISLTLVESNMPKRTIRASIESQLHGRYQLSLGEVVDSVKKGSKILMEGRPGVGKTTLLRQIAKQWAEGNLLQSFQVVILIQLGHISSSGISNLESMLEYLSHDNPDTASVARELGRTGGEGICFLLDALDEYSPQSATHSDYIYQLISGDRLPNAALIVTSRPSASYNLQQVFTRKIEVVGFFQHQIQQYINALPANITATISDNINRYTNVKHISYLPLHLAMMTYLASHSEEVSLLDLDTETRLYHMFVNLTFRQRYKDIENLDKVHSLAFSALSKCAFDATINSETSLRLHNLDPELRTKVESFSITTMHKQHEGDKVSDIFTFSHYTFQEFFAAYHLTTLPHEEQMQALKLYQSSSQLMWRFFFGLLRTHSSKYTTKLFEKLAQTHIELERPVHSLMPDLSDFMGENTVLLCAYELKQTAIAEVLVQALNHSITIYYHHPSECAAIGYALSLSSHQFNKMTIFSPSEEYIKECFIFMSAELPDSNGVVQVAINHLVISDNTISALAQFVRYFPNLQQLEMYFSTELTSGVPMETTKFVTELEQLEHLRLLRIKTIHPEYAKFVATLLNHLTNLQHLEYNESIFGRSTSLVEGYLNLAESLKHLTSLQTLRLQLPMPMQGEEEIGKDEVAVIVEGIEYLTSLQALELTYFTGTGAVLAESLKHLISLQTHRNGVVALPGGVKNLKEITLKGCEIEDRSAAKLVEGIKHLTSLETLNLARNRIGYKGIVALTGSLESLTSLKMLDLSWSGMRDRSAVKLAEGIKHLSSLETLNLAGNRIGYDGAEALVGGIKNLTSLKTLNLHHNTLEDRDVAKLVEGIKHLPSLETLNLAENSIGYVGVVALTGGIKSLTSLKTLDLSYNKIGSGSAAKLVEGIKHLPSLETLNLAWNRIGYKGVAALTGGFKILTSLKTLDLSWSELGDRNAAKLAEGIKCLPSLETLSLAGNRIGYDGIDALIGGLKRLTSLKTLDLSHNIMGDRSAAKHRRGYDGIEALIGGVKDMTSLKTLDLSHNEIGGRSTAKLVEGTKHLTSLKITV